MDYIKGLMMMVIMAVISLWILGFYFILPYWLVVSALDSVEAFHTIIYFIGFILWLVFTSKTFKKLGNSIGKEDKE